MRNFIIFSLFIFILVGSVYAIESLIVSFPNFMDTSTIETITARVKENATFYTNNTFAYNVTATFTYVNASKENYTFTTVDATRWYLFVSDSEEEDVDITIFVRNASTQEIYTSKSDTLKFRKPFYVEFHLFKGTNDTLLTDSPSQFSAYCNEFQMLYLQEQNNTGLGNWGAFRIFKDLRYLDDWFDWVPFYDPVMSAPTIDYTLTYWDWYDSCISTIKLYEHKNYSLNVLSYKQRIVTSTMDWEYEFIKPQFVDHRAKFESTIINEISLNKTNQSYFIFLTPWEIDKQTTAMNASVVFLEVCIWIAGIMLLCLVDFRIAIGFATMYWPVVKIIGWLY